MVRSKWTCRWAWLVGGLLATGVRAAPPDPGGRASHAAKAPLRLKVQDASIRVVDEASGTRFDLTGVRCEATPGCRRVSS